MFKPANRWTGLALLSWVLSIGAVVTLTRDAEGNHQGFDERSIEGSWGYSNMGAPALMMPPVAAVPTPYATVAVLEFDGEGGCYVHGKVNVAGQTVDTESINCEYTVEPDGLGTALATFTNAPTDEPFPVSFVIVNRAREIHFTNTMFAVGGFVAKRQ